MKWYYYLIIGIVALILITLLIIFISYKVSLNKQKKKDNQIVSQYVDIIEAMGSINNIISLSSNGSRLSFELKDVSLLKEDLLKEKGITGIIKTSKKVTLVIGDLASKIKEAIEKELNH